MLSYLSRPQVTRTVASIATRTVASAVTAPAVTSSSQALAPRPYHSSSVLFGSKQPIGSGNRENLTGKVSTGFSVKDSDIWQNASHEWRSIKKYQGPIRGVILDWAGTVLDCGVYSPAVVFIQVFEKEGVPISMDEARKPMGAHKKVHIRKITEDNGVRQRWHAKHGRYPDEKDVERMFKSFVPLQLACLGEYTDMIPGAVETVNELQKKRKLRIGSTTGFTRDMVNVLAEAATKQGYTPDCYVAADEVPQARPFPFMVWQNAIKLNISPIAAIVKVDDTADGVTEGVTAGCWSVGLARSGNYMAMNTKELDDLERNEPEIYKRSLKKSYDILAAAGAHYVIDDINGLPRVIDDINRRLANGEAP